MNRYRFQEERNPHRFPLRVGDRVRLKDEFIEDYTQKSIIAQLSSNRGLIVADLGDRWTVDWSNSSIPKNCLKYMVMHE